MCVIKLICTWKQKQQVLDKCVGKKQFRETFSEPLPIGRQAYDWAYKDLSTLELYHILYCLSNHVKNAQFVIHFEYIWSKRAY